MLLQYCTSRLQSWPANLAAAAVLGFLDCPHAACSCLTLLVRLKGPEARCSKAKECLRAKAEVADSPGLVAAECAGHCLLLQASLTLLPSVSDPLVLHQEHHVQANAAHQKQLLLLLLLLQNLLTTALPTRLLPLHCVRA